MIRANWFRWTSSCVGVTIVAVCLGCFILNRYRYILAYHETPIAHYSATLYRGCLDFSWAQVNNSAVLNSGILIPRKTIDGDPQFGSIIWRPRAVWRARNKLLRLPLWIPAACGIALMLWSARSRPANAKATCPSCGYDLRGLADQPCPECGTLRA